MIAVAWLLAASAVATQPVPSTDVPVVRTPAEVESAQSKLAGELMSPFCAGLTLENCPTSGAAAMRDQIGVWLQEGRSEEWILDTLVTEWGESILGAPRFRGLGVVAWLAPFAALAVASFALMSWLRRQRRLEEAPSRPVLTVETEGLRRRVDEEIARLDG